MPGLLKDVLRDEWGFKGITVSDHGAIKELIKHGTASDPEDAVRVAIKSGINMSMSDEYYSKYLPGLIKSGKVTMAELDDAARHVLNVKYDMGLFNDPYSHLGPKNLTRRTPMLKADCIAKKRVKWRVKVWYC